jgi:hypothetical protein
VEGFTCGPKREAGMYIARAACVGVGALGLVMRERLVSDVVLMMISKEVTFRGKGASAFK